ncbi:hypothetical protein MEG_00387 [Bartonella tamiae Th307]|uniref:Uncharacterized protein n=1 Tax=Bartonella tamiae Th239 TaxID=1094558 RepID=J0R0D0_9HYPH|nr:hypothetical protein ME5_01495 [Bartonella tamiae Th239]EJF94806.1 hypothetical protein MEG_00387 [Bartonella tamiae Th307]
MIAVCKFENNFFYYVFLYYVITLIYLDCVLFRTLKIFIFYRIVDNKSDYISLIYHEDTGDRKIAITPLATN